jgi:hypothetical protein
MSDQQEAAADNFELMDHEDEEQILLELRGVPVDKFIYADPRGNFELTYAGAKWVVRKMAEEGEAIRVDGHPKVDRCVIDPDYITCTVIGKRVKVNLDSKAETVLDTTIGSARGWIKQKIGKDNPKIVPDDFFFNKTVSKATRNMQLSLIPTDFKKAMIEKLKGMRGAQGAQSHQSRPPQGAGAPVGQSKGAAAPAPAGQPKGAAPAGAPAGESTTKPAAPPASPAIPAAPAAGATPPKQTAKPVQPKTQTTTPATAPIETVQHGFRAVFVAFAKTEDNVTLKKILKALTGKTAVTDLERELMLELGPLLRRAINNQVKWNGSSLHEISSGEQLWPKVEPQVDPTPEPQHEEAPPPQEEAMF